MLVRWKPRIFVSSSIVGLEALRADIRSSIEGLGLTESWLFEFDEVAAGPEPRHQYLQAARDCDLFVLVVGEQIRAGTEDEYREALKDNPDKVIPFLYGEADSSNSQLRKELRRHTYRKVDALTDLPAVIANSVGDYVTSGAVARPSLLRRLIARRQELRLILGMPAGFEFVRELRAQADGSLADYLRPGARVVLVGPAGSGKTDAAVGALVEATAGDGRLPIVVRSRPEHGRLVDSISATFDSAMFTPGTDLITQYLRDGRLAIVVDGLDELSAESRETQIGEIERAADQYPRTAILVLYRSPQADYLPGFSRVELRSLDDEQLEALFSAAGRPDIRSWTLGKGLRDLVALPFWAALVARHGNKAKSAVGLLDVLVTGRLRAERQADDLARLRIRGALGAVALAIRPSQGAPLAAALDAVEFWLRSDLGRRRFSGKSAEIVDAARGTGLVAIENSTLLFPHPLVAAFLAAEHAIAIESPLANPADEDMSAFVACMLPESSSASLRDLLAGSDIFTASAFLRLSPRQGRTSDIERDLVRLDAAYERWAFLARESAEMSTVSMLLDRGYVCVRRVPGTKPHRTDALPLDDWAPVRLGETVEVTCWRGNPMLNQTPEQVAATLVLNRFKKVWVSLQPAGSPFAPLATTFIEVLEPRGSLGERIVAFLRAVAAERRRLLATLGLSGSTLDSMLDEPHVVLRIGAADARFVARWGNPAPRVDIKDEESEWIGESIRELAADAEAVSYRALQRDLELRLGSAMASQAIAKPTPFGLGL